MFATTRHSLGQQFRRAARRGFTLVEIASAIIIPHMGSRDDMKAAAAARVIVADLIYAQNLAISTGTPVYVRFDRTNNKYSVITNPLSTKTNYGDLVMNPITQNNYIQVFGDTNPNSVDPWESVSIDSVSLSGIDPSYVNQFTVGFDEIGSPYVYNYTVDLKNDLADGSNIVIRCGTLTTQINIAAATGEITVQ
jgi:hypothetical protein